MNHNILNKIIDKVAFNRWNYCKNLVNQEFKRDFISRCAFPPLMRVVIYTGKCKKCNESDMFVCVSNKCLRISKRLDKPMSFRLCKTCEFYKKN